MNKGAVAVFAFALAVLAGCVSIDPVKAREKQTEDFLWRLADGENAVPVLLLSDCIQLAMTNNYEVRKADLSVELAKVGRTTAFSAFLPQAAASVDYVSYSKDPVMSKQRFASGSLDIGQAVFMPATWFLYAEAREGIAASELAALYTRQAIALKTTSAFYDLAVQHDLVDAARNQLVAASNTYDRVKGLADEGMARPWEADRARYLLEARSLQLSSAIRELAVRRGKLLVELGLSPLSDVEFVVEEPSAEHVEGTDEDLVMTALMSHPQLSIADRMVVQKENAVRRAFCGFLPSLSIFASPSVTGNDIMGVPKSNFALGFKGAWDLFKGFANASNYKKSKLERREAELDRESTFLSIMSSVIAAHATVEDARQSAGVLKTSYDAAVGKAEDLEARAKEGLVPLSDSLDANAERDLAQVEYLQSKYREIVAIENLRLAMGTVATGEKENENE